MKVDAREIGEGKGAVCRAVLEALPDWFGIPEAIEEYVRAAEAQPMIAAFDGREAIGFVSLKVHFGNACEVYSMGVLSSHHRAGIGRALIAASEAFAIERGCALMTVKTLSAAVDNDEYARTRAFYLAMGFLPIEELPTLWGPRNPCLLLAKPLAA